MSLFSGIAKTVKKIGKQTTQNIKSAGALPFELVGGIAAKSIQGVAPALGAATGVLRANPELAGLAGGAIGMPGLGGLFGGSADMAQAPVGGQFTGQAVSPSIPMWVWIAGGIAAALGLFLFLRKKS